MSIKPEFDVLAREMGLVSKKVMTGNDVGEALEEFSNKYDSPLLRRSINLIIGESESGGQIVEVIDKVIENSRKTRLLKEEMAASTVTYMIFIGSIVMVIAPALFALSGQLLMIINSFASGVGENASGLGFGMGNFQVKYDDFRLFSMLAISTIAIFSGMIISIIEKGDVKGGLRYIPLFLVVALALFVLFDSLLATAFGGIIG